MEVNTINYINIGINLITFLSVIIVGFIFNSQIKSQKGIIKSMADYVNMFNVDELKKFTEIKVANIQHEHRQHILIKNETDIKISGEYLDYILYVMYHFDMKNKEQFINNNFPSTAKTMIEYIRKNDISLREQYGKLSNA